MDGNRYIMAVSGQGLVHRVVHNFPHKLVETLESRVPDVHAGGVTDRLETLKDPDLFCAIVLILLHFYYFPSAT